MSNTTTEENDVYYDQVAQFWNCFKSFKTEDERQKVLNFLSKIAELKKDSKNDFIVDQMINDKALSDYVGHKNVPYLARFLKAIASTESIALKDKMIELIEGIAE